MNWSAVLAQHMQFTRNDRRGRRAGT